MVFKIWESESPGRSAISSVLQEVKDLVLAVSMAELFNPLSFKEHFNSTVTLQIIR
jgi:hypothetical protein